MLNDETLGSKLIILPYANFSILKHIALNGWNGQYNIGDDAMTSVIMKAICEKHPEAAFWLLADRADLADYGVVAKIYDAPNINFWRKVPFFRSLMMNNRYTPIFARGKDLMVFGGGSIFQHKAVMMRQLEVVRVAKKTNPNVKLIAIGVSCGPFKHTADQETAVKLLGQMDFIGLRDRASKTAFDKLGLSTPHIVAPDIALLLPKFAGLSVAKSMSSRQNFVGVSLRHGRTDDGILEHIAGVLSHVLEQQPHYRVKFFQFCALPHENDLDLLANLLQKLPTTYHNHIEVVPYSRQPLDTYTEIQDCKLMLCVRLHAAVLSFAMKTPFLVYPYHTKCTAFATMVGSPDSYTAQPNEAINTQLIDNMLAGKTADQFALYDSVIQNAEQHFSFL